MQKKYDVIIVGAGIAGSFLAYMLKLQNHNVLLIEKQSARAKDKLCGGLLTKKTIGILYSNFDNVELDDIICKKINYANVFSLRNIRIDNIEIATVDRKEIDNYILNKYLMLGGELLDKASINSIDFVNKKLIVENDAFNYNYLVGADGVFSYVRKCLLGSNQNMYFSLETFVHKSNSDLSIHFKDKYKGYSWVIPNKTATAIGTGDVSGNTNIKNMYEEHASSFKNKTRLRGAFLPTSEDIFLGSRDNAILIGDAAGLISPVTGEGIYYALESARIASLVITKKGDYKKLTRPIICEIKNRLIIKRLVFNDSIRNFVFLLASKNVLVLKVVSKLVKKYLLN